MSKEMTAESEKFFNRRTVYPKYGGEQLPSMHVADAKHYGDLRAKEAVREFAEELMRRRNLIMSEPDGIVRETMIANLLVDLFLDHQKKQQEGKGE